MSPGIRAPAEELRALAQVYGLDCEARIAQIEPWLGRYAEWVLGRESLAVVTLAPPEVLAMWAGGGAATERLLEAARRWPAAITGIKLDLGGLEAPTLYVRTMTPWAEGLFWLLQRGLPALEVPAARTLYGLGFQGEVVKTYSLAPDGFVSWRLDRLGCHPEHKTYKAEVPWRELRWPDERWASIGALGEALGFAVAGHVGERSDTLERKVYVERVGGIPTDHRAA